MVADAGVEEKSKMAQRRGIGINLLVFVLGILVCAVTLHVLYGAPLPGQTTQDKALVMAALERPVAESPQGPNPIASAAAKVTPAIVTIDTESKPIPVASPFAGDPFFQQFFGGRAPQQTQRERGVGSGVLISPDGYILTNNHVVADAATMKVTLSDGKTYQARLIGTDPTTDIAVCKIDVPGRQLPYAQLGDSKQLVVGDEVIAVGNPLDIGTTVTFGIVSALGHRNGVNTGVHPLASDIIQTDAAINPGNSGGALADLNGRVIGINEAIYSPTGSYVGIGFAIPIDTARTIAEQLIQTGTVVRPYIGIGYEPLKMVDQQSRQQVGITVTGDDGAIVLQVYPNSPAAQAGLQQYDVIMEANRQKITSDSNSLQNVIGKLKPGDRLVLLVNRSGRDQLISITVKQMPKNFGAVQPEMEQQQQSPDDDGDGGMAPGF
jgi:serine protease DegS/serine protease DegQ